MSDKQVIEILTQQNERLLQILEKFAGKEQHVNVVVNSYNGSEAQVKNTSKTSNGGVSNSNELNNQKTEN